MKIFKQYWITTNLYPLGVCLMVQKGDLVQNLYDTI